MAGDKRKGIAGWLTPNADGQVPEFGQFYSQAQAANQSIQPGLYNSNGNLDTRCILTALAAVITSDHDPTDNDVDTSKRIMKPEYRMAGSYETMNRRLLNLRKTIGYYYEYDRARMYGNQINPRLAEFDKYRTSFEDFVNVKIDKCDPPEPIMSEIDTITAWHQQKASEYRKKEQGEAYDERFEVQDETHEGTFYSLEQYEEDIVRILNWYESQIQSHLTI